jgi:agmatine deiminase
MQAGDQFAVDFDAATLGWRMPGEFEPHAATWMAWPCRRELWGGTLAAVKLDYARLARAIARFEPVWMVARPDDAAEAMRVCGPTVQVAELPLDDSWTRDTGPTFLTGAHGSLAAAAWRFNAWGDKYHPYDEDARLGRRLAAATGARLVTSALVLEGGAILSDGEGTLLTTESCLLNANRNPGWSRADIEAELRRVLGVRKIIWLPGDPTETETDGHIDGLMALIGPAAAMIETAADPADPRHRILRENLRALELATDAHGRAFRWLPIEEAEPTVPAGPRDCRSYVNFYLANGAVLAPAYGLDSDERVRDVLCRAFPGRAVIMLPIGRIASGGGGFHCITQQVPRCAAPPST